MSKISEVVNLRNHPIIESKEYIKNCNINLINDSILKLDNFLNKKSLLKIQKEALILKKQAFFQKLFSVV